MAVSRYETVKQLFMEALEQPPAQRPAFVRAHASADVSIAEEVLALLAQHIDDETGAGLLSDAVPERIGPYAILSELGHGGMGVVYRVRRDGAAEDTALKVVSTSHLSPALLARFDRETRVLRALHHPGIARFLDSGVAITPWGMRPYIEMECVAGRSLREAAQDPAWSTADRLRWVAAAAQALQHAHQQGVVHRDLKPENLLVRADGSPVVLDFGVAHATAAETGGAAATTLTATGMLVGTIRYMSPEQVSATSHAVDARSDVYSLGVIAYELLSGTLPYDVPENSLPGAILAVATSPAAPLGRFKRELRGPAEGVLATALQKLPAERYESAGDFAADLLAAAAGQGTQAAIRSQRRRVRRLVRLGLIAVALVAAGAFAMRSFEGLRPWEMRETRDQWFAQCSENLPQVESLMRGNQRTEQTLHTALDLLSTLERDGVPFQQDSLGQDVMRLVRFRHAEATQFLAELNADAGTYEKAARLYMQSRSPRRPPGYVPGRNGELGSMQVAVGSLVDGEKGASGAAGCYHELSFFLRPRTNLELAISQRTDALELLRQREVGSVKNLDYFFEHVKEYPEACRPVSLILLGRADGLFRLAAITGRTGLLDQINTLDLADTISDTRFDPPPYASLQHARGEWYLERALRERSMTHTDSALVWFEGALVWRTAVSGNLSHWATRRAEAEVHRVRAAMQDDAAAARELGEWVTLIESEKARLRTDVNSYHRGMLSLTLARLHLDLAERGEFDAQWKAAQHDLLEAERDLPDGRLPWPAALVHFERMRAWRMAWERNAAADAQHLGLGEAKTIAKLAPGSESAVFAGAIDAERARLQARVAPPAVRAMPLTLR